MALHAYLKRCTEDIHVALHKVPIHERLLAGSLSRDEYQQLLSRYFASYRYYESLYCLVEPRFPQELPVVKWLVRDLSALGLSPNSDWMDSQGGNRSFSEYLGYCYVKHGATLGARVLAKKLRQNPAIPESAVCFFSGNNADTLVVWEQFKSFMEAHQQHVDFTIAGDAALAIFSNLYQSLSPDASQNVARRA